MRNLDRHNLICPENYALTTYTLNKADNGQTSYVYKCCSVSQALVAIEDTIEHETAQTDLYVSLHSAHYLDRQTVKCPGENQLINRMQLRSIRGKLWYSLTCYQLAPGFTTANGQEDMSDSFDMGSKISFEFDGVDLDCMDNDDAEGVQFLIQSKLKMNYSSKPHSAAFSLQCSGVNDGS